MKWGNLLRLRWLILIIILMDGGSYLLGREALKAQNEGKHKSFLGAVDCDQSPSLTAVVLGALAPGFLFIAHVAATLAGGWRAYPDTLFKCNCCLLFTLVLLYVAMSFLTYAGVRLLWSGAQYNYSIFKEKDHTKCSSFFSSERVTQGWGEWASLIHLGASLLYCLLCYVSVKGICGCLDGRSSSTANISTTKKEKNNDISLNKV